MLKSLHLASSRRFAPLAFFCLLSSSGAYAAVCSTNTNYDTTTTCDVPPGVTSMRVQVWGGGGGGNVGLGTSGAGGGGGSFCGATVSVTAGTTLSLAIGLGGGIVGTASGNPGGPTSITGTGFSGITANGGSAPNSITGAAGGDTTACTAAGATAYSGGAGGTGRVGTGDGGGGGGSATPAGTGGTGADGFFGGTGGTGQGNGGDGGIFNGGAGTGGSAPGGGGGGDGALGGTSSGAGADGRIIILAFNATQTINFTSTAPNPGMVGNAYLVTATGGGSGNPVTFSIDGASSPGACSINGSTISFAGTGTCIVDANQAAGGIYLAAPQVQQSITVVPAPTIARSIPTLSEAMLMMLSAVLVIFGMAALQRRKQ